jgi:Na+/H+ antiporter NhaD/arsenite permease-like protein
MVKKIKKILSKDYLLSIFTIILLILAIYQPEKIKYYPQYIDTQTIFTLLGLLLITTGIKESYMLRFWAAKKIKKIQNERNLSLYLISLTVVISMFLTNDISLFIVVPLTLSFQKFLQNDLKKIIIFEAIAANTGSMLTPIGNPQNLFLWTQSKISFFHFIKMMLPPFSILFFMLIATIFLIFPTKKLQIKNYKNKYRVNKKLLIFSFSLFCLFILGTELKIRHLSIIIFILYLIFFPRITKKTDYILLLIFILMFIDFKLISQINIIKKIFNTINPDNFKQIYLSSIGLSQIMSNVPATIFISQFTNNTKAIAYGVNIAGNGLLIGSLANIIALRFINDKKIYLHFHKYSIPFFILSALIILAIYQ